MESEPFGNYHVRENEIRIGSPNMTTIHYILPVRKQRSLTLQPNYMYQRHIRMETAQKWFHHLSFEVIKAGKGIHTLMSIRGKMLNIVSSL